MIKDLENKREQVLKESRDLMENAESEDRDLSEEEEEKYNTLIAEYRSLTSRIERMWSQGVLEQQAEKGKK